MQKKKNKMALLMIGGFIVIVLLVMVIAKKKATNISDIVPPLPQENQELITGEQNAKATSSTASLTYEQALIRYKNRIVQVNQQCQASPGILTFKNPVTIMVDNRSPLAHTFKLGSTFTVKAYGFKIVELSSASLPATFLLDCDKLQNIATVILQK